VVIGRRRQQTGAAPECSLGYPDIWRNNLAKDKPKKAEEKPKKAEEAEELKHIVRIMNSDLEGKRQVHMALAGMKGVGRRTGRIFAEKAGVDPYAILGLLPDEKINDLKKVIEEASANLPVWMMNRRKDIETGLDKHVMGMDLAMTLREDLDLMKKMRSYKGIRHERGLRVRGQKTRSTGRTGAIVGVSRKKEGAPAAAPAATKE
jgi:small subunit ribosomal protein S13